jgi:hypothetical protein
MNPITKQFVDQYISDYNNNLDTPVVGGTDPQFAEAIAPSFFDILEIARPATFLEIGFNVGGSALMFLSINSNLIYHSIDIVKNEKSVSFFYQKYKHWKFFNVNSALIRPCEDGLLCKYDIAFIDGDHSSEGVLNDTEIVLSFKPKYVLFDDVDHPSHKYIRTLVEKVYCNDFQVIKEYKFDELWEGYSMLLCKVKY